MLTHVDGLYWYGDNSGVIFVTHYTLYLYLKDSVGNNTNATLVGGATAFLAEDRKRRLDINPKTGSVLIFQHKGLPHEGTRVQKGIKYTIRTDILSEWIPIETAKPVHEPRNEQAEDGSGVGGV